MLNYWNRFSSNIATILRTLSLVSTEGSKQLATMHDESERLIPFYPFFPKVALLRHGYTGDYKEKGNNRSDFDGNTALFQEATIV